jgi:hypothetical protein
VVVEDRAPLRLDAVLATGEVFVDPVTEVAGHAHAEADLFERLALGRCNRMLRSVAEAGRGAPPAEPRFDRALGQEQAAVVDDESGCGPARRQPMLGPAVRADDRSPDTDRRSAGRTEARH